MNGVTLLEVCAKDSSDSCDLRARTERECVVRSWSRLASGMARSERHATRKEPRAAAFHADVHRCPESRFSAFCGYSQCTESIRSS